MRIRWPLSGLGPARGLVLEVAAAPGLDPRGGAGVEVAEGARWPEGGPRPFGLGQPVGDSDGGRDVVANAGVGGVDLDILPLGAGAVDAEVPSDYAVGAGVDGS